MAEASAALASAQVAAQLAVALILVEDRTPVLEMELVAAAEVYEDVEVVAAGAVVEVFVAVVSGAEEMDPVEMILVEKALLGRLVPACLPYWAHVQAVAVGYY